MGKLSLTTIILRLMDKKIKVFTEEDPSKLPWKELDIDVVIEATGKFTEKEDALRHVEDSGAKKVIISAPAKGESDGVQYIVLGVNDQLIDKNDVVISNSSCTTNNVAPMIMILDKFWGIEKAFITTVHSYTTDQNILDGPHKDLREVEQQLIPLFQQPQELQRQLQKYFRTWLKILVELELESRFRMVH